MTLLMTMRVEGDGAGAEQLAEDEPSVFSDAFAGAREAGLISHRFYASDQEILIVDEWPTQEAFDSFFHDAGPQVQAVMSRAGVTKEPVITFWRKLETGDDVG